MTNYSKNIEIGDLVQTTQEYNSLCTISGEVIEILGNKVIITDDDAETEDTTLEFHISDLKKQFEDLCQ
tara:strand:- start:259 stop:465 length:207 start_codon:yes stop_codon:yes gene_type:complete